MRNNKLEKKVDGFIDELIRLRKEQGLSHERLAEMAGMHRSTISLIENKRRNPTLLTCLKICDALNVSMRDFLDS